MGEAARRKRLNKNYGKYCNTSNFSQLKQNTERTISLVQDISDNFSQLDNLSFRKDMVQLYYVTNSHQKYEILDKWLEERENLELQVKQEIDIHFQRYHPSSKTNLAELMMFYILKIYLHESMSQRGIGERMYFLYFIGNAIIKAIKPYSEGETWQQFKKLFNESMSRGIQTDSLPELIEFNEKIQNKYPQLKVEKIQYCYRSSVPITRVMHS